MPTTDSVILTPAFLDALVVILSAPTVRMELMDLAQDQCFTDEQLDAITDLSRAVRDISGLETDDLPIFLDLHLDADGEVRGRADADTEGTNIEGANSTFGEEEMPAFDADIEDDDGEEEEEEEEEEDPDSSDDGDDDDLPRQE